MPYSMPTHLKMADMLTIEVFMAARDSLGRFVISKVKDKPVIWIALCILTAGRCYLCRYVRTVEELQRVEVQGMSREERLAFFINLYNMMSIHAILVLGHPTGALERRRLFGEFQYIVGGCTYSLSAIQNGILRGNQRAPYSLMKPFGAKDKRLKVNLYR